MLSFLTLGTSYGYALWCLDGKDAYAYWSIDSIGINVNTGLGGAQHIIRQCVLSRWPLCGIFS